VKPQDGTPNNPAKKSKSKSQSSSVGKIDGPRAPPVNAALSSWQKYGKRTESQVGQKAPRELPGENISISYKRRSSSHLDDGGSDWRQTISNESTREVYGLPPIVFEIFDDGVSGTTTQRDGYQQMKSLGAEYRGATVIVEYIDRAIRSGEVGFDFGSFIIENELVLYDSKGLVTHDRLLREIGEASGAHKLIKERTQFGRARAIRNGSHMGPASFGYEKPEPGVIAVRPELVPIVQEIFQRAANDETGGQIARWLMERGILTSTGKAEWNNETVLGILDNFIYVGIYEVKIPNGETVAIEMPHATIVDLEVFDTVQALRRAGSKWKQRGPQKSGHRSLLAGKTRCPICGKAWKRTHGKIEDDSAMICSRAKFGCKGMLPVSLKTTESNAIGSLKQLLVGNGRDESFLDAIEQAEKSKLLADRAAAARMDKQIAAEEAKIARSSKNAHESGMWRKAQPIIDEAEAKVAKLKVKRAKLLAAGFRTSVSVTLRALGPALDFLMDNLPMKRTSSEAEAAIRALSNVIVSVDVEHLPTAVIRQTTVYDFNPPETKARRDDLVRTVTQDYRPPPRIGIYQASFLDWIKNSGTYDLADHEFQTILAVPLVQMFFGNMSVEELRRGFNGLILSFCTGAPQVKTLTSWCSGPGTRFSMRLNRMKMEADVDPLTRCLLDLRPDASNAGAVHRRVRNLKGYIRGKLQVLKHPILDHPICCSDDRSGFTANEWAAILDAVPTDEGPFKPGRTATTKSELEFYFTAVRTGSSLSDCCPGRDNSYAKRNMNEMIKAGLFNQVCHALLVHADLRSPDDTSPLPEIPVGRMHVAAIRKALQDRASSPSRP
jgi:DNA invertase Pin-like site-specific DNA recombinase